MRGHGGRYRLLTDEDLISLVGAGDAFIHTIMDPTKNRFHARLLDAVGQAVIAADPLGKVIYWNRAAQELYGWSAQEAMGRPIVEVTPSEELAEQAEEIMGTLSHGRSWTGEFVVQRKDGTTFPALATDTPVHDEQGNLVAIIGVSTDITQIKQTEELRRGEERFRATFAQAAVGMAHTAPDGRLLRVNRKLCDILGYTREEMLGMTVQERTHPDDFERDLDQARRLLAGEIETYSMEKRFFRKDDSIVWINLTVSLVREASAEPDYFIAVVEDIDERKRTEIDLDREREFLKATLESLKVGIVACDAEGNLTLFNKASREFHGVAEEKSAPDEWAERYDLHYADGRTPMRKEDIPLYRAYGGENVRDAEMVIAPIDGPARTLMANGQAFYDDEGNKLGAVVAMHDITERKRAEEWLQHQAFHDPLTDLPNRYLFVDRLGQALIRTTRPENRAAVLFMDLDGFKVVNDSLGHEIGDRLLVAVAERLKGCLRPKDTLARFAGDEFIVLIEEVEGADEPLRVTQRITEEFQRPFVMDGREIVLRFSIGVALGEGYTKSPEELLRDAATAMYRAKDEAADYKVFDPAMYEQALRRLELENDLRHALEKEEFTICYQPKFRLGQPDRIEGVEALIRWEHPQWGFMLPSDFIPVAEETGLIIPIGGWVMKEACHQAKEWQERYPSEPPLGMCVNLSARQVRHPGLLQDVSATLRESGLVPGSLILEITEGTLLKDTELLETIFRELKALGVRLAIDDFGKEYSSLSYLKRLPVDVLKIDGSFVASLGEDPANTTIVEAVIKLAHSLGLEVTGEWVESAEQLAYLRRLGCDHVQGYFLAKPQPSEEVESLLANQPAY